MVPVVKAYPALLGNSKEVVCVAGFQTEILTPPKWIRLFPVPYRDLDIEKQFAKWQMLTIDVVKTSKDRRPESFLPLIDSIKLGRSVKEPERRSIVDSLSHSSMCELIRKQQIDGTSLGIVRPRKVLDLLIEPQDPGAIEKHKTRASSISSQPKLFGKSLNPLEIIPHRFLYSYLCDDHTCNGHKQGIIDWEIGAAYRNWRTKYPIDFIDRIKKKWLDEMCGPSKDTVFFVGNMHQHPSSFLILGVYWPKKL
jgi:hypothetical protein